MSDGGKGDKARPLSVPKEEFDKRWDEIFRKDPKEVDDARAEDEEFERIQKQNS